MISHRHRCIFVHIPGCAGTTVESLIWPGERSERTEADLWMGFVGEFHNRYQTGGLQHLFARHIRHVVGDAVFNEYLKFAVVRNPWDKAVSGFSYLARRPDLRRLLGLRETDPFAAYLRSLPGREHVQWARQLDFLTDDRGELIVDRVLRFERLAEELPPLLAEIGVSTDGALPRLNASERKPDYRPYYSQDERGLVARHYRRDVERLGYGF
jgi:Sulfotransferase family